MHDDTGHKYSITNPALRLWVGPKTDTPLAKLVTAERSDQNWQAWKDHRSRAVRQCKRVGKPHEAKRWARKIRTVADLRKGPACNGGELGDKSRTFHAKERLQ